VDLPAGQGRRRPHGSGGGGIRRPDGGLLGVVDP
jgi:hypothetical protein